MSSKQILRRIGLGILTLWLVSLVVFAAVLALPGRRRRRRSSARRRRRTGWPRCASSCTSTSRSWRSTCSGSAGVADRRLRRLRGDPAAGDARCSRTASRNSAFLVVRRVGRRDPAVDRARRVDGGAARPRRRPRASRPSTLVLAALPRVRDRHRLLILLFATERVPRGSRPSRCSPPGEQAWEDPQVVVLPGGDAVPRGRARTSAAIMRGSMIEVLESEYVTMARLKGLPERHGDLAPRRAERDRRRRSRSTALAARVDGRRHRRGRVRLPLPRHRRGAGRRRRATATCRSCRP